MKKTYLYLGIIVVLFSFQNASAFDRLNCSSRLHNWTVHNDLRDTSTPVLSSKRNNIELQKPKSLMLSVRDEKGNHVGFISPWRSPQFFSAKGLEKNKYKFDFKKNKTNAFSLNISQKGSTQKRSIACQPGF